MTPFEFASRAVSRASFLSAGGAVIVSFGLPPASAADAPVAAQGLYPYRDPAQLDTWIAVSQDGTVTFFTGRIDFGQRKSTAFAQIVADELDVAYDAVKGVMGDTALTPNQGSSEASDGVMSGGKPIRRAAAEARRVLLERAAQRFSADPSQLTVKNGEVSVTGEPARRIRYGELVGNQRFDVTLSVTSHDSVKVDVSGKAKLKDPHRYEIVGKSIPARDIPGKVLGTWPRVHNVRLPGMLHARLLLPPSPGAHLMRVGTFKKHVEGVVTVVNRGDFVAVVAKNEWAAIRAADELNIEWSPAATLPGHEEIFTYLRTARKTGPQRVVNDIGNTPAALAGAAQTLQGAYHCPIQNHGMIGPSCAVADVKADQVMLYAGTQDPPYTRAATAKLLNVPLANVRVIPVEPAGCYGRLGLDDASVAAALISQAVGKPVRVQFTRAQEHVWSPMPPPWTFDLRAGVDATGKIVAWDQHEWTWALSEDELPVMLVPRGEVTGTYGPLFRPPGGGGIAQGIHSSAGDQPARPLGYVFPNSHVVGDTVPALVRALWMRSPGRFENNFCGELFMDEVAAATKQDPIAFRLRHVEDERSRTILERVAQFSSWDARPSPGPEARSTERIARGRGMAMMADHAGTWVATVAHVEVDRLTGNVTVKRIFVVADAGIVVNPDGMRAQIEGATLFGTSRALKEEVTYDRSKLTSVDWLSYPILRFTEIPDIFIDVVNRTDLLPFGIGEPPNATPPAAIGNAIYDATGIRLRALPYTPKRVKAALAQA